jgi:hypothetical protein
LPQPLGHLFEILMSQRQRECVLARLAPNGRELLVAKF